MYCGRVPSQPPRLVSRQPGPRSPSFSQPRCSMSTRVVSSPRSENLISTSVALGRFRVLGDDSESRRRLAPHLREVLLGRLDSETVQLIEATRALRLVDDETGIFQQTQVARDGRPADRQLVRDLLHRVGPRAEQLHYRPAMRVAERPEWVGSHLFASMVTFGLR